MDPSLLGRPIPTPTAQKPTGLMTKRTLFIVLGCGVVIVVSVLLMIASQDNSGQLQQRLSARQATMQKIIADGQKNISDDDLAKLNSEISIVIASDDAQLQTALKTAGFKKVDKAILAAEADSATFEKLTSAKLNAQYDSTYRGVLSQKLESLRGLLKELYGATKSKSLKTATNAEYKHLSGYQNALSKLPN